MYQVFSFLLDHLHYSKHFFFTIMEQLFMNHPIFENFVPSKIVMIITLFDLQLAARLGESCSPGATSPSSSIFPFPFKSQCPTECSTKIKVTFLDAPSHLYKRSCPSVRRPVGPSPVISKRVLGASCVVYPALL